MKTIRKALSPLVMGVGWIVIGGGGCGADPGNDAAIEPTSEPELGQQEEALKACTTNSQCNDNNSNTTDRCVSGVCTYTSTSCTAAGCPNGCCNGNTCVPFNNQSNSSCGRAAAACRSCGTGSTCSSGTCSAPTWCSTNALDPSQTGPSYQCLDFDSALPPTNVWVPHQSAGSTYSRSTAMFNSAPASMTSLTNPDGGASLTWTTTGSNISMIQARTEILAVDEGGYPGEWDGARIDLLCAEIATTKACVSFSPNPTESNTTFFIYVKRNGSIQVCDIPRDVPYNAWTRLGIEINSNQVLATYKVGNGTYYYDCGGGAVGATGKVQIGAEDSPGVPISRRFYFDNLQAFMRR